MYTNYQRITIYLLAISDKGEKAVRPHEIPPRSVSRLKDGRFRVCDTFNSLVNYLYLNLKEVKLRHGKWHIKLSRNFQNGKNKRWKIEYTSAHQSAVISTMIYSRSQNFKVNYWKRCERNVRRDVIFQTAEAADLESRSEERDSVISLGSEMANKRFCIEKVITAFGKSCGHFIT